MHTKNIVYIIIRCTEQNGNNSFIMPLYLWRLIKITGIFIKLENLVHSSCKIYKSLYIRLRLIVYVLCFWAIRYLLLTSIFILFRFKHELCRNKLSHLFGLYATKSVIFSCVLHSVNRWIVEIKHVFHYDQFHDYDLVATFSLFK